jgi:SYP5 family syntaxin
VRIGGVAEGVEVSAQAGLPAGRWCRSSFQMREQQELLKDQDETLDTLHGGVQRIKALGGVMRDELAEQAVILDSLEDDVERTDSNMQSVNKRLKDLVEQTKKSDKALWSIIGCLLVLLAVLTFLVLS